MTTIQVTVKTLDSQNHQFDVSEELTVKQFKEEISPRIGMTPDQQRLIFRGRVLQDDKTLKDYQVASNVLHLVQRQATASSSSRRNNDEPYPHQTPVSHHHDASGGIFITGSTGGGNDRNAIIMGTISGLEGIAGIVEDGGNNNNNSNNAEGAARRLRHRNGAAVRLQVANDMLTRASNLFHRIESNDGISTLTSIPANHNEPSPTATTIERRQQQPQPPIADDSILVPIPNLQQQEESEMEVDLDLSSNNIGNSIGRAISQVANAASAAAIMNAIRQQQQQQGNGNQENTSTPSTPPPGINISNTPASANNTSSGTTNSSNGSSNRSNEPPPRVREMSLAIQDLLAINQRLTPYLQYMQRVLGEDADYSDPAQLESVTLLFNTLTATFRHLSRAYHAYGEINCDFSARPDVRCLRAPASILVEQSAVVRATIPIPVPVSASTTNTSSNNSATTNSNNQQQPTSTAPNNNTNSQPQQGMNINSLLSQLGQLPAGFPMNLGGAGNFGIGSHPGITINIQGRGVPQQQQQQGQGGIPNLNNFLTQIPGFPMNLLSGLGQNVSPPQPTQNQPNVPPPPPPTTAASTTPLQSTPQQVSSANSTSPESASSPRKKPNTGANDPQDEHVGIRATSSLSTPRLVPNTTRNSIDDGLPNRDIPTDWENTIRHDIQRQLNMPAQPPFSPAFCSLFSPKH